MFESKGEKTLADFGAYEQHRRQISSVIISKETIGKAPENMGVRIIEVPVVEEVRDAAWYYNIQNT